MGFVTAILAGFALAFAAPGLHRLLKDRVGLVLALYPLGAALFFAGLLPDVANGEALHLVYPWIPSLGINLSFYVDGLSLLFLLVISVVGFFIVLYAQGYLKGSVKLGRFYLSLLIFMSAMLGVVSADNIITLFVFWELTSLSSYLLIGYYHEDKTSRDSALQALLVTGGGGLALLAGFILLGNAAGTYSIAELLTLGDVVTGHALYPWILALVLLGAFTKSAQFPFHFWLPNAMAAPAPVSAYLHSATMVKAGVFLMARLHPTLGGTEAWFWALAPVGAVTMLIGVTLGLGQRDLKKILAYTTLSVLGTLTMLIGLGTDLAIKAAMAYLLAHALYKGALFMTAGSVDHETGTRDVDALGGLGRVLPFTATGAVIAGLSMAGIPLLLGFLSKEYFYKAALEAGGYLHVWAVVAVTASVIMVCLAMLTGFKPYFGKKHDGFKHIHETPWLMWLGPILLGLMSLKFGILPGTVSDWLVLPAAQAVSGTVGTVIEPLKFPAYIDTALILSVVTLVLGIGVFFLSRRVRRAEGLYRFFGQVGPERGYGILLNGMLSTATGQTKILQSGYLRYYLLIIVGFAGLLIASRLVLVNITYDASLNAELGILELTIAGMIVAGTLLCVFCTSRVAAIVALGVVGLGIALIFLIYGAIDLALTQIIVETLTVILFVFAFFRLPKFSRLSSNAVRIRDAIISIAFGLVMTAVVILATQVQLEAPISDYFAEMSYVAAYGRNVVNVILVDFRALDTLGEIAVLAIAALGIYAMLKLHIKDGGKKDS